MRVWLFNCNLFVNPPKYCDQDAIFIDLKALVTELKLLKEETKLSASLQPLSYYDQDQLAARVSLIESESRLRAD